MRNYLYINCTMDITENPMDLDINDFLDIAIRNNKKRRFLFVSKNLGKHLACKPSKMDELGKMIVDMYNKTVEPSCGTVIAFAETGTGLGHSFFDYINGDYEFVHTTREEVKSFKKLEFLEEHSHATDQNLYYDNLVQFKSGDEIILVDDEITTANTCLNIIKKIQSIYPKKRYTICSILNWVEGENIEKVKKLEKELECKIEFVYLFKGKFKFDMDDEEVYRLKDITELEIATTVTDENRCISDVDTKIPSAKLTLDYVSLGMDDYIDQKEYIKYTGRFGMDKKDQSRLKEIVKRENKKLNFDINKYEGKKVLFLGTEELMYIPMLFAKENEKNIDLYYHSTTRSPIIAVDDQNYPIKTKNLINSFYNSNIDNYIYNIDKNDFEECFLFVELVKEKEEFYDFIELLKNTSIEKLTVVSFNKLH
jgi:orotate phosphoribosyltransferase-like protein